jgi:hypothetical protein
VQIVGAEKAAFESMASAIEKLTGYRPPTCPWRAMYDPLIGPVIRIAMLGKAGLGHMAPTEPAILADAVAVYLQARNTVAAHDEAEAAKLRLEELKKRGKK